MPSQSEQWMQQEWYANYPKPPDLHRFKTPVAKFLRMHLDLPRAANVEGAVWNEMALAQINTPDTVKLSIDNKARQRGWSFNEAAIAVARSIIYPRSTTCFISFNQDESTNKIRYCQDVANALRPEVRPQWVKANETELVTRPGSRIVSLPCKEPRGMPQARIVLDEYGMYNEHAGRDADKKILIAALGAIAQSGCIRIGSTPKPVGLFRELADPAYSDSKKMELDNPPPVREWPWWMFGDLCRDRRSAKLNAWSLTTEQRVDRYGTDKLKEAYSQYMFLGDISGFQQEYECAWISEAAQLIPEHLVTEAVADYEIPERLPMMGVVALGADFGRRQDMTAYVAVHAQSSRMRVLDIMRLAGEGAQQQADALIAMISRYRPFVVPMDVTDGFGQAVYDLIRGRCPVVKPITFSSRQFKEEMMSATVGVFVNREIALPKNDPEIARDIASVRKVHAAGGAVRFEAPRDSKGHADSFFALAMAINELPRSDAGDFSYETVVSRPAGWGGRTGAMDNDWDPKDGRRIVTEDYGGFGKNNDWYW